MAAVHFTTIRLPVPLYEQLQKLLQTHPSLSFNTLIIGLLEAGLTTLGNSDIPCTLTDKDGAHALTQHVITR